MQITCGLNRLALQVTPDPIRIVTKSTLRCRVASRRMGCWHRPSADRAR